MKKEFKKDLENLLNKYSIDNDCNTPDFILAEHLVGCIEILKQTNFKNHRWHGNTSLTDSIIETFVDDKNYTSLV
jgi:hypothetical protein